MRSVLELLAVILCLRLSKVIMLNVHCSLKDNLYNQILVLPSSEQTSTA